MINLEELFAKIIMEMSFLDLANICIKSDVPLDVVLEQMNDKGYFERL